MKTLINLTMLLVLSLSHGQTSVKKSSVSTAGGSSTAGTITVIYAIGEVAVQENNQGNIHLSEGFIGPGIVATLGIEDYTELTGIKLYPNPVDVYLNIELPVEQGYEIYLYDLTGKQLIHTGIDSDKHIQLDMSHLPATVYMLMVVDRKNHKTKILKIQKL